MSDGIERAAQRINDRHFGDNSDHATRTREDARVILDATKEAISNIDAIRKGYDLHPEHRESNPMAYHWAVAALACLQGDKPNVWTAPESGVYSTRQGDDA